MPSVSVACAPLLLPPTHHGMLVQDGWTPLLKAALEGHVDVVKALLAAGAEKEAATQVRGPSTSLPGTELLI